jgi:hypothetical protein
LYLIADFIIENISTAIYPKMFKVVDNSLYVVCYGDNKIQSTPTAKNLGSELVRCGIPGRVQPGGKRLSIRVGAFFAI